MDGVTLTTNSVNITEITSNHSYWVVAKDVAFQIQTYYLWVILALGFPGNCATIVTVLKMSPAKSLTVYIALLAVLDNLSIINKLLVIVLLDYKIQIDQVGCKLLGYLGNSLITFANWLLVAMSVERFAAVWFPLKLGQHWSLKNSIIVVSTIGVLTSVMFLPLFWIMKFEEDSGSFYCDIHKEYAYFMMHIWFWINVMVYAIIPCVLLTVFNCLIVAGLHISRKIQTELQGTSDHNASRNNRRIDRYRPITIMLVTAAVTLVVLTTPRCIMLLISPYWNPPDNSTGDHIKFVLDTIAFVLCDFTHAVNFYVYSLSAKMFRRKFRQLCCCCGRAKGNMYSSLFNRMSHRDTKIELHTQRSHTTNC